MRRIAVIATFFCASALGACGLKGDLYLPEGKPAPAAAEPAPVEPASKTDESPDNAKPAPPPQ
jgi:predicted small lipoprotein YifL